MKQTREKTGIAGIISYGLILAALWLLVTVCGRCYPQTEQWLREQMTGLENTPVREAFGVLTEGLEEGKPIQQVLHDSAMVFREQTH